MGEISEMMLDGTLCCICGDFIDADTDCPTMCEDCAEESEEDGE